MARAVFAWLFLILVYFFINNSLVSQLAQPALIYPGSDNSFWLLHIINLPQSLARYPALAIGFDLLITCSCIVCIFVPNQRVFTWITVIGVWILYVVYCSALGKHYAQIGYMLAVLPFLALQPQRFNILWELFRYWACFLYATAGIYKLYYGGFWDGNTMSSIIFESNAEWLVFIKEGWRYETITYLIDHPGLSQWFYRAATLMDLAFIIGFFTKRFDKWLLLGLLTFHVGNFLLLHISFVEQSLIFAAFLPWQRWAKHFQTSNSHDRPYPL